jgi:hypothetical protein
MNSSAPRAYAIAIRSPSQIAVLNALLGTVIRVHSVQGKITSTNVSGKIGTVQVLHGRANMTYVYDLDRGTVIRTFCT